VKRSAARTHNRSRVLIVERSKRGAVLRAAVRAIVVRSSGPLSAQLTRAGRLAALVYAARRTALRLEPLTRFKPPTRVGLNVGCGEAVGRLLLKPLQHPKNHHCICQVKHRPRNPPALHDVSPLDASLRSFTRPGGPHYDSNR